MPYLRAKRVLVVAAVVTVAVAGGVFSLHRSDSVAQPNHVTRDALLRGRGVVIYTPADPARALVLFFGNDIGFWRPHHALAADLASEGYAVVGVDIRPLLAALPEAHPARDSACASAIRDIASRARRELSLDSVPLVIGGHSLGAELALWAGAHAGLRGAVGVLALSPGTRSHLRVSASDILMTSEPAGPDSFGIADVVADARDARLRVAIVRGAHDKFASADARLLAVGGTSTRRFNVPLASHSLRDLTLARYVIHSAMAWLLEPAAVPAAPTLD